MAGSSPDRARRRYGALLIPDLRIAVPLYEGEDLQEITDAPDSAVFFRLGVQDCIADHCHQEGFERLAEAVPDRTRAWISSEEGVRKYVCIRAEIGRLVTIGDGHYLRDSLGEPVYRQNAGGVCIYTCTGKTADAVTFVRLTFWQPENTRCP